jgi:hypothetical protein
MDTTAPVKCSCGRTVPPLSPHRPGAAHTGLRAARKTEWCPDTDLRKKQAEEAAAQAKIAAEQASKAAEIPAAPAEGTEQASKAPDAPAAEAKPE